MSVITSSLSIQDRPFQKTKGNLASLRQSGWIPSVIYGGALDPQGFSVLAKEFIKKMQAPGLFSSVFDLGDLGLGILKDMQFYPTSDRPIHIDFLRLIPGKKMRIWIPLKVINEALSPGLKKGGVLNITHHKIELFIEPELIPQKIVVDLEGLDLGSALYLYQLPVPDGAKVLGILDQETMVSIVAPSGLVPQETSKKA